MELNLTCSYLTNLLFSHATLQFIHRWLGVLVLFLVTWYWLLLRTDPIARRRHAAYLLFAVTMLQVLLGIYTLVNVVPITAAVLHQGGATILLLSTVYVLHSQQGSAA